MIVRPRHHWFRLLFVWRGSVLPEIVGRLSVVLCVSILSVLCRDWWLEHFPESALSIPPFTLMGVALAIFLGFRNSVSYERFWEARKQWGGILIAARALMRQLVTQLPDDETHRALRLTIARQLGAFNYALKHQLRQTSAEVDLRRYLGDQQAGVLLGMRFQPLAILTAISRQLASLRTAGRISDIEWLALDKSVCALGEAAGACERIAGTPIPYTYRVLMNRTVMVYSLLLPIGLASSTGWVTLVIATFVAYTFLALEMLAEQLEEPFGTEANDLPLDALCHTIECAVCELAGIEPLGKPPLASDYVLT